MLASNSFSSNIFFTSVKTSPFSRSFLLLKAAHDRSKNRSKSNIVSNFSSPSSTISHPLNKLPPFILTNSSPPSASTSNQSILLTPTSSPFPPTSELTPKSKGILKRKSTHLCDDDEDSSSSIKKKVIFANPVVSQTKLFDLPNGRLKRKAIIRRRLATDEDNDGIQESSQSKIILTTDEVMEPNDLFENSQSKLAIDLLSSSQDGKTLESDKVNLDTVLSIKEKAAKNIIENEDKLSQTAMNENVIAIERNNACEDNQSQNFSNCDTSFEIKSISQKLSNIDNDLNFVTNSKLDHIPLHHSLIKCKESVDIFLENAFSILSTKVKAWFNVKGILTVGQLTTLSKNELNLPPQCPIDEEIIQSTFENFNSQLSKVKIENNSKTIKNCDIQCVDQKTIEPLVCSETIESVPQSDGSEMFFDAQEYFQTNETSNEDDIQIIDQSLYAFVMINPLTQKEINEYLKNE